jgi:hypothetical protein
MNNQQLFQESLSRLHHRFPSAFGTTLPPSGFVVSSAQAQVSKGVVDVNIVQVDGKRFGPVTVSPIAAALPVQIMGK